MIKVAQQNINLCKCRKYMLVILICCELRIYFGISLDDGIVLFSFLLGCGYI